MTLNPNMPNMPIIILSIFINLNYARLVSLVRLQDLTLLELQVNKV
jgi:hypothetical protein